MGKPLRVAVDGFNLSLPHGTGLATYTRNLEAALVALGAQVHTLYGMRVPDGDTPHDIAFFDAFRGAQPASRLARAVSAVAPFARHAGRTWRARRVENGHVDARQIAGRLPRSGTVHNASRLYDVAPMVFRLTGQLQRVELDAPVDIFHTTCPMAVTMKGVARVCTVHDLIPLTLPFTTLDHKEQYFRLVRRVVDEYDMLFAVSEKARADLVQLFGVSADRIQVTYQSIEGDGAPADADVVARVLGLAPRGYLLFTGAIEPKKNLPRLLEAFLGTSIDLPLVIAGPDGWMVTGETRHLRGAVRSGRVVRLRYLARSMVLALIRGARALVMPSLSEGFGLPALEAMLLGTPVVAARAGALPEVCGDAALYVDPYDVGSIAAALKTIVADDALGTRLVETGRRQAARFSAEEHCRRLQAGYAVALERARQRRTS